MAAKCLLVLCASACFAKIISAQCAGAINGIAGPGLFTDELALSGNILGNRAGFNAYGSAPGYAGYGAGKAYGYNAAASSGGGFQVTSISPISPTGISVVSENAIEGPLSITGELPFLGAIALDGALPSAGSGAINYGCGNGAVGIVSEGVAPSMGPAAYPNFGAAGLAGLGYSGLAGPRPCNAGLGLGAGLGYGAVY